MKIFVGNLSPEVNETELTSLFSEHGNVSTVTIVRDSSNQMSRGFGFVEMPRKVDAKKALKTLNDFELKGQKMAVNEAKQGRDRNSAGNQKRFSPGRRR
ncbi:MAG: RNA-binding protein [Ignavibacteriaceae bacterium]|jgi:RNA recognition motif-containing protein|nr:RNA-binding protein [Ignavibacteriaceae bacterium]